MSMLTEEELQIALAEAARMRVEGEDPNYVSKALLKYEHRNHALEYVLEKAKHFLHSGQAAHEHTELVKAIERADAEHNDQGEDVITHGLE